MAVKWNPETIKGLDRAFFEDVNELLSKSEYLWLVTEGCRSFERSAKLNFAFINNKGPRAAPAGKSAHNYGLAIDVVLDGDPNTPGVQPTWNIKLAGWLWLKKACTAHPRLKNGWSFNDWPHIERYNWKKLITPEKAVHDV